MILRQHYATGWVLSVLLPAALLLVFAPVIFGGKTLLPLDQLNTMMLPYSARYDSVHVYNHFLTDALAQVYPYKVRWRANMLRGEYIAWNPMIFGGHPHYASTSFTHFDPTNIMLLIGDMPAAYHLQILVKLLIAGLGMWVLLSSLRIAGERIHGLVRATAAVAYMLNSLFITTLHHQWLVGAMAWTPWTLVCSIRLIRADTMILTLRYSVYAALCLAGVCLSGSLQTIAIAVLGILVVVVSILAQERFYKPHGWFMQKAIVFMAASVLGWMLSAIMWLPALELFAYNENIRAAGKPFSMLNSLKSLPLLVSFVIPELIGTPRGFDLAKIAQADMNDFNAYVGFAPCLLGVLGCVLFWKQSPRSRVTFTEHSVIRSFILLAVLGLLLPLATPLYKFLYHRSFALYVLGICVVGAAAGQYLLFTHNDSVQHESLRRRVCTFLRYVGIGLGVVALAVCIGNVVLAVHYEAIAGKLRAYVEQNMHTAQLAAGSRAWMLRRVEVFVEHFSWRNPFLYVAFLIPGSVVWLIWQYCSGNHHRSRHYHHRPEVLCSALLILTIVQLWIYAASWLPMIETTQFPLYPSAPAIETLQRDTSLYRFLPLFDTASHRVMQPNINDMYGIACVQGYESIFARNVSMLAGTLSYPVQTQHIRLGALANVKYYVASAKNPCAHPLLKLVDSGATCVYRNTIAEERAYMRYRYRVVAGYEPKRLVRIPNSAAYMPILTKDSLFCKREVLFNEEPYERIQHEKDSIPHRIRFLAYQNNSMRLEVATQERGYLILADSFYPGWRALVNGEERPILNANYVLRAVAVPKGVSIVEFRFEPLSARVGMAISMAGLTICLCMLVGSLICPKLQKHNKACCR